MHSAAGQSVRRTHTGATSVACLLAVALGASGGSAVAEPISSSALWLRADAIIGVANGGAVSAWNDANGNGRNYEQATTTRQPLLSTTDPTYTINGRPGLRFDGGDDFLQGNSGSLAALNNVAGASVFAVRTRVGEVAGAGKMFSPVDHRRNSIQTLHRRRRPGIRHRRSKRR